MKLVLIKDYSSLDSLKQLPQKIRFQKIIKLKALTYSSSDSPEEA